jgi:hypothetical protein
LSILDNFPRLTKRQRLALLYTCSFILNLLFTVPLSAPILVPKANAVSSTVVSTEIIDYYTMSSSQVTSMINIMQAQGIPEITLRLNAFSEWSSGTPSSTGVAKAKEIITEAASQGINVSIDSHTW